MRSPASANAFSRLAVMSALTVMRPPSPITAAENGVLAGTI